MSVELLRIRGPLDDEKLGWLTQIYGPVDAKYRSLDYVRHQFVANPFGWSVHVFAVAAEGAVGHCGVVPFAARLGDEPATVGKLEALAVAPAHRGRRAEDGGSVATDILTTLYAFAHENELPILFGLAPPPVARIHMRAGCRQVPLDAPAYVLVSDPRSFGRTEPSRKRRAAATALSLAQSALTARARATPQPVIAADAELAAAETADGTWTVSGADAWDWYAGSGVLRALELPDSRVLVRVDEAAETTVQIVAWRATRGGLLPAARALRAAARVARDRHAPTLRFQPWRGSGGGGELARACRLLGFVRRPEAPLLVHTSDERFDRAAPRLTPFFYVTF